MQLNKWQKLQGMLGKDKFAFIIVLDISIFLSSQCQETLKSLLKKERNRLVFHFMNNLLFFFKSSPYLLQLETPQLALHDLRISISPMMKLNSCI